MNWLKEMRMYKMLDNPICKGVFAGLVTAGGIAATTAFAPIGVVGATGWAVVYTVAGGTFTWEALKAYLQFSELKKKQFDEEIGKLKKLLDENVLSKAEFDTRAKVVYERLKG